jgi:hypothetical protein
VDSLLAELSRSTTDSNLVARLDTARKALRKGVAFEKSLYLL